MVRDGAAGAGNAGRVPHSVTGLGSSERGAAARSRASSEVGGTAESALDLLELLELSRHECRGEAVPPAEVEAADQVRGRRINA